MFRDEINAVANAAKNKLKLLNENPLGYLMLSILAGIFVGFGILLVFTSSGLLNGAAGTKIIMGAEFSVALSLVVIAGAELFTGNNFVMTVGTAKKTVTAGQTAKLWIICWLGNLLGAIILGIVFTLTGLASGATAEAMASAALGKITAGPVQLLMRGVLCNFLVCLAVWCGFRSKSDSGKLIMIFWCILTFFTCGFEHSVANMTLFVVTLINPCGQAITLGGELYNLLFVTIGNIIGGALFTAVPYLLAAKEKQEMD